MFSVERTGFAKVLQRYLSVWQVYGAQGPAHGDVRMRNSSFCFCLKATPRLQQGAVGHGTRSRSRSELLCGHTVPSPAHLLFLRQIPESTAVARVGQRGNQEAGEFFSGGQCFQ